MTIAPTTLSKFQKFEAVNIDRSEIQNAAYNPRVIHPVAKSKLKKSLKKNGLVETLVWNKRTKNLVGGHQRLEILDSLEGSQDYQLTVAQVDISPKQEKELNIFLNNPTTQGEFNFDLLKTFKDIDWMETGFDQADVSYLMADGVVTEMENNITQAERDTVEALKNITADADEKKVIDAEAKKAHVKAIKEMQKEDVNETGERFIILTFRTLLEKKDFLVKYGFPEQEKYVDAYTFEAMIKKH